MSPPESKAGPGGGAPEPRCIAVVASAVPGYSQSWRQGNRIRPGASRTRAAPAGSRPKCPVSAFKGAGWPMGAGIAYRDSEARKRGYRANRGCIADVTARKQRPSGLKNNQRKSESAHVG